MGIFINKGNFAFQRSRNSEYVDKTELIAVVNSTIRTRQCYSCVSRCRRFGKSMAAEMLCAYYDRSCDSRTLFADLKIASHPSFEQHLNKYPVIYLDMTSFMDEQDENIVERIDASLLADISKAYGDIPAEQGDKLMDYLLKVSEATGDQFIFIIDEWDAICREYSPETRMMDRYVGWLRRMFKSIDGYQVFAAVYMTGILPIKRYNTQSAMNNFIEYSMVSPRNMAGAFGFTKEEVQALAVKHGMDYDELVKWYDGYQIGNVSSVFNPNSVMQAISNHWCDSYWNSTAAYDTVSHYIQMNFDGLRDYILILLGGGRVRVNTTRFLNDLSIIRSKDDVLTVLVHLGYLAYDRERQECYVPNYEVMGEMSNAIEETSWTTVIESLRESETLLAATLRGDEAAVANDIDRAHDENTSILSYNDENSLACVLAIAYYAARAKYVIHREYASGKGFADLVMIPRKNADLPAIIIELKYNHNADAAIGQIVRKQYSADLAPYADRLLLVGINYNRETKRHECRIMEQTA